MRVENIYVFSTEEEKKIVKGDSLGETGGLRGGERGGDFECCVEIGKWV